MPVNLEGRVVLVTGSGRGVGRGIVDALSAEGASVVASVHHGEDADALIAAVGGPVKAPVCDVTVRGDVEAAVAVAVDAFGRLDAVVHNAGHMVFGPPKPSHPNSWRSSTTSTC